MQQQSTKPKSPSSGGGPEAAGPQRERQPRGNAAAAESVAVQAKDGALSEGAPGIARKATKGGGGALPYLDRIQKYFGRHDINDIRALIGGAGGESAQEMGAEAYASGDAVVFQSPPDLHTAAHEAAHVVQQRAGVRKAGGVGAAGDVHERHADSVADLVVQGKSAESLLDQMVGKTPAKGEAPEGAVVQMLPEKKVGAGAMRRVGLARAAIKHVKEVIAFGAGNQYEALKASNFNSYFRMAAMRDDECWEMSASVRAVAAKYPQALTAAMGDLAQGGNCGEHAQMGFDYLRVTAGGDTINQCDKEGLDHAFVIIGDIPAESDSSLAVCDPWPSAATACIWEDHFAHTADKTKLNVRASAKADGFDAKSVIAAGLKLSAKGLAMINQTFSEEKTQDELKKGTSREDGAHPWIWRHGPSASTEYDYQEQSAE